MLGSNDVGGATRDELEFGGNARKTMTGRLRAARGPHRRRRKSPMANPRTTPVAAPAAIE